MSIDTAPRDDLVVDSHVHLWDLAVRPQPWTDGLPPLRRSFGMDELRPRLRAEGVDGVVLVQSVGAPEENADLLEVAVRHPQVLGVVGWVDLTGPAVPAELARLRALPGGERLVGVRHQVVQEADPGWLLRADVLRGLRAVAAAGLAYDLLLDGAHLPAAAAAVRSVPGLRVVVDHAAQPGIAEGTLDPWRDRIAALASVPGVTAKLSGLLTQGPVGWAAADVRPFVEHLLEVFGPSRLMAGSDWPVCLLRADYAATTAVVRELVSGLDEDERRQVLGATAARAYRLAPVPA